MAPLCHGITSSWMGRTYYITKTNTAGSLDYDSWTSQLKMIPREFRRLCLQPMTLIDRKVMMYPRLHLNRVQYFLTIDPDGPLNLDKVCIPYRPKERQVVSLENGMVVYVDCIEHSSYSFEGYTLRKIGGRNPQWTQSSEKQTFSLLVVCREIKYNRRLNYFHLYDNE